MTYRSYISPQPIARSLSPYRNLNPLWFRIASRKLEFPRSLCFARGLKQLTAAINAEPNLSQEILVAVLVEDEPFASFEIP